MRQPSPGCIKDPNIGPELTDPDGSKYSQGKCSCNVPHEEQVIDSTPLNLPVVDEIGYQYMYQVFDSILSQGPEAIPQYEHSMDIGMSASIEAAQTIAQSGKQADSFLDWFDQPCNVGNYTKDVEKIFNPLCDANDPPRESGPNTEDSTVQKIRRGIGQALSGVAKGVGRSIGSQDASSESDNAASDETKAEQEAADETTAEEEPAEEEPAEEDPAEEEPAEEESTEEEPAADKKAADNKKAADDKAAADLAAEVQAFADNSAGKSAAEKTATAGPEASEDSVSSKDSPAEEDTVTSEEEDGSTTSSEDSSAEEDTETSENEDDIAASSEDSLPEEDTETVEDDDTLATEEDTETDESDTGYDSGYGTSDSLERRGRKPKKTTKSGKKTKGAGSDKKDKAASSGRKDTTASSEKKDATATSKKQKATATSGSKDATTSAKDGSTTGSESTSAAQTASTTSLSSKDAGDAEEDSTTSLTEGAGAGAAEEDSTTTSEGEEAAPDDSATDSENAGASEEETKPTKLTSCPLKQSGGTKGTAKDKTLGKRVPPDDVQMDLQPDYGKTYMGIVNTEEVVSNALIRHYAKRGYDHIRDIFSGGNIMVAALHVNGAGVVVASSARPSLEKDGDAVSDKLTEQAKEHLPAYWEVAKDRKHRSGKAIMKWHAEDVAMVLGASCLNDGPQKIATYGRYEAGGTLGPKPPCSGGVNTKPTCKQILAAMEISIVPLQ
ncbi:MAG: hypothetical protein Q9169_005560 [Polycauliona sp. 2 TL-2023]